MQKNLKLYIALSIIPQILLIKILSRFPEFVERFYTYGLYQFISSLMRYVFGWIPFSVGDLLYTIAGIYIIRWLVIHRKRALEDTKIWVLDILSAISIAYFAFHILWAFNYYRLPLHESLHIENEYTTERLIVITNQLIDKSNELHGKIINDDSAKIIMPYSKRELIAMAPKGYQKLSKEFPHLAYQPSSLKRSLYSLPLTYMGFSGYLNPFTNEAHIDGLIPGYKYPTTCSHEIAHQIGYAAENEANFIGSMAAMHHEDPYFQYSGYTFALAHCLSDLYRRDPDKQEELFKKINIGILKNYQEARDFWESYQNPSEIFFKNTYSGFLKANNQTGGIDSYSYVVALFVNYYEHNPL